MARRRWIRRSVRRLVTGVALWLVLDYLVLPQVAGARKAVHLLSSVNLLLLALAAVLEVAALWAYGELTYALLPAPCRPARFTVQRIDLSTFAVSHLMPGGTAAGTGLGYQLLTDAGVPGPSAGFALAAQGLGSAVVLNLLLWVGLVISIPLQGFQPLYGTAALLGVLLIGAFAALVALLARGEEKAAAVLRSVARRVRFLDPDRFERVVGDLAKRLRTLIDDPQLVARAVGWAAGNWLLDACSLWVFLLAFGYRMGPDGLLVSYGLANVLGAIPITPGGLGVVEGVLVPALVGFGAPRGPAILAVVTWRLVNFWLPIPLGGLAYLTLRVDPARPRSRRAEQLRTLAARSRQEAEPAPAWAARHGLRVGSGGQPLSSDERDGA